MSELATLAPLCLEAIGFLGRLLDVVLFVFRSLDCLDNDFSERVISVNFLFVLVGLFSFEALLNISSSLFDFLDTASKVGAS